MKSPTITILKEEYLELKKKANILDKYVEEEQLSQEEINMIEKALKSPIISKEEFLNSHPELI